MQLIIEEKYNAPESTIFMNANLDLGMIADLYNF
jgi:hypothetical protein